MYKRTIIILNLILWFFTPSCNPKKIEFNFVGRYTYKIVDQKLFEATYLHESFGFLIGDLEIQGLEINNVENLPGQTDYIISLHYPVDAVYVGREEAINQLKRPIQIKQDKVGFSKHVYIYSLLSKDKYSLPLP